MNDVEPARPLATAPLTPLPVVSLFCGAGGLDEGFRQAGFHSCLALDSDEAAVRSFNRNHPGNAAKVVDLMRFRSEIFLQLVHERAGGVNPIGLIGGPPCQGVSNGNNSADASDPRNGLMSTYMRLVQESERAFGLDFFLFENVPGLLRDKNKSRLQALKRGLSKAFHVSVQEVNALDFGVPQNRRRVLIVGLNKSRYSESDLPSFSATSSARTVREAIGHLPEASFFARGIKELPFHPNHWTMQPKSKKFTQAVSDVVGRSFLRLDWDKPSRTVAYGNREMHVHPLGHRRVSVLEAMLFQGFPESYKLEGTLSQQVAQVCNAVPPPLARAVAEKIRSTLKDRTHEGCKNSYRARASS